MIVEGQGISLWTRVRLPSTPLDGVQEEPQLKKCKVGLYENVFGITFYLNEHDTVTQAKNDYQYTFTGIQKWINDNLGVQVSKSSITVVKDKCKIDKIGFKTGIEPEPGIVHSDKERAVLKAFRALGIV